MQNEYCVVLTTTSNREEAEELARKILAERLAACVQIQAIHSFYMWKGEVCSEPECLLAIKTKAEKGADLQSLIARAHSYETPEIIQLPISSGSARYFEWIDEVVGE